MTVDQPGSEFAEHRVIKAGVGQFQAQRVLPVDAGQDGMNGLTVGEILKELKDGDQREFPGCDGGLAGGGEEGGEILVGVDRAELVTESGDGVAFWENGTDDSGGVSWDGWNFLWFDHRSFLRFSTDFATGIQSCHHPRLRPGRTNGLAL